MGTQETTPEAIELPLVSFLRSLTEAPDGDAAARAVGVAQLGIYRAEMVVIYLANCDRDALEMCGQWGLSPELARLYARLDLGLRHPACEVFLTGAEMFIDVATGIEEYPITARAVSGQEGGPRGETGVLPLRHQGTPMGVIGVRFGEPPTHDWAFRTALDGTVSAVSLWSVCQAGPVASALAERSRQGTLQITDRQRQVLAMVSEGRTNAEIARRLGFSEKTIKADLTALYRLLGASGRDDLVARAGRSALLGP